MQEFLGRVLLYSFYRESSGLKASEVVSAAEKGRGLKAYANKAIIPVN
ncbi:hypothetical protein [Sphingobacterium sp. JB170]|nr:hypothetical protein [Sphingobacterium sp. JB170]SJN47983.1 hypothetical protein FM107_16575 [Sphingobacterium sp. JB170]